ncbi:MAG: hypothetical protein KatS3mg031_2891 [Chitinophagales bacterium]|nr:MAG: hypothetical protein KatS3mg031_2891 [Chitinophagales bacterium]
MEKLEIILSDVESLAPSISSEYGRGWLDAIAKVRYMLASKIKHELLLPPNYSLRYGSHIDSKFQIVKRISEGDKGRILAEVQEGDVVLILRPK